MNGIKLGNKQSRLPIIQGGMGIGVSMHSLAGHVAKNGGIGIISTADIGYKEPDFFKTPHQANLRAVKTELEAARSISPDGIIGFNVMVALSDYDAIVEACVAAGADLIISGAGLPMDLPKYVLGSNTKIAPIVSSSRALALLIKRWKKKYDYLPDMVVIEGPKAGGHLGFAKEDLDQPEFSLESITRDVVDFVRKTEKEYDCHIPVVVAGGVFDGSDIASFLALGADGVQMATRFVTTVECDASDAYKQAYIDADESNVTIIKSPVGMPGRALLNSFIKRISVEKEPIRHCYNCIKTCNIKNAPYCITKALIDAVDGDVDNGLVFCGSNVGRLHEIITVEELMETLESEIAEAQV